MWDTESFPTTVTHAGGVVVDLGPTNRSFTMVEEFHTLYQLNGGTIISEAESVWHGYGYWHLGGTMEITADSQITVAHEAILSGGISGSVWQWDGYPAPILKFSGTDTKLTMDANVYLMTIDGFGSGDPYEFSVPLQLDVGDLTMTDPNNWLTIIETGTLTYGELLDYVPGTDANWELQVVGNLVQVKGGPAAVSPLLMGDCNRSGYVDDDDLSLLLANWHATTTWDYGNLSDSDTPPGVMGYVDDDDLSLLLANWHAGTSPMGGDAVPEPATIALLALGGLGALIRRRR